MVESGNKEEHNNSYNAQLITYPELSLDFDTMWSFLYK